MLVNVCIDIEVQVVTQQVMKPPEVIRVDKKAVCMPQKVKKKKSASISHAGVKRRSKSVVPQKRCHTQPMYPVKSRCKHCRQCYKCKDKACVVHFKIICSN